MKRTKTISSADRQAPVYTPGPVGARRELSAKLIWLILAGAAGLIAAGILNGGLHDVLIKAVYICTECIGLG